MNRPLVISVMFLLLGVFYGCASRQATSPPEKKPLDVAIPAQVQPGAGWEADWEKTLKAAKKEGSVLIYTSAPANVRDALSVAFTQKYGIKLEGLSGRGADITTKLLNERKAGIYTVDVFMAGLSTPIIDIKPTGSLTSLKPLLILPEVVDPKVWYGGDLNWSDKDFMILRSLAAPGTTLVINSKMANREEVKSYADLLNPRWKGKIVMNDPTIAGNGSKTFVVVAWGIINLDYWREFAKQEPTITRDQRLQVEWMSQGKYPIALYPQTAVVLDFINAGVPLEFINPKEGVHLSASSSGLSFLKNAPHPNAAKIFFNWILSREGQIVFSRAFGAQSARLDVPTEGIPVEKMRQPGVKYFLGAEDEEWVLKEPERIMAAKEIFGPLMK